MKKIGLLSDTHGYVDNDWLDFFKDVDEIWHAGDIGSEYVLDVLEEMKPVRAVFGNCDGYDIRSRTTEILRFDIEGLDVLITHIGGYPGRYEWKIQEIIKTIAPGLFISGHSHILKVINDKTYKLLHINPGAAGIMGMHKAITCVRFEIENGKVKNLELFEKQKTNRNQ